MSNCRPRCCMCAAVTLVLFASAALAQSGSYTFTFTPVMPPGANTSYAGGINNHGKIVGAAPLGGFVKDGDDWTHIYNPWGDEFTAMVSGISDSDLIIGQTIGVGFVRVRPVPLTLPGAGFALFSYPGGSYTRPNGVNSAGAIVGDYVDPSGTEHSFLCTVGHFVDTDPTNDDWSERVFDEEDDLYTCDSYMAIEYPGSVWTYAYGINNNGDIVGFYRESGGGDRGFLRHSNGSYEELIHPGAPGATVIATFPYGINNLGQVVGHYQDNAGGRYAFLKDGDAWVAFNHPDGANATVPLGINDDGVIVGVYSDQHDGWNKGFQAAFARPATPIADLSPTNLTFAGQPLATSSAAQSVTLSSAGNADLTVANITVDGDFSQSNSCPGTLAIGANCSINVAFTPTVTGARNGTLTLYSNAADSPHTVSLTGTGTDFALSVSPSATQTVKAGKAAIYTLSLFPESGFTGVAALGCSVAPAGPTCTLTPTSVQLDGTGTSTASATVSTKAGKKGTPKGTYTLTFTATAGTLSHSTGANLVVR